ncbi:MAG: MaoC/PaaZ C-terminal domain-containing protein [Desulfatiglans sp.]|jgi:acyl dehydratase|nr:MaoC/PaaZ C-terminal domain-containing protein [Thermodesulfobacteriota bacterium]MEE4352917.1 MaoC/PaaZ C-terminal domain-containing protein [Desulfatiglans sp.]
MAETKFFEDLNVGDKTTTNARTVTEADIVGFAGLSGDYNPIHVDAAFAQNTPFKERIAHGLLVLSIASGLFTSSDLNTSIKKNLIALMEVKCSFLKPVLIGDTIHVEATIKEKKELKKPGRGIIVMERIVYNQKNEAVQNIETVLMMKRREKN